METTIQTNTNVMVDIESLGTNPGSVILSIGAVVFDKEKVHADRTFYCAIDIDSCLRAGLVVDGPTINWWLQQEKEAQIAAFSNGRHLHAVLTDFGRWYQDQKADRLWAHGTTFDIGMMEAAHRAVRIKVPWSYRDVRDTRLLYEMAKETGRYTPTSERGGHHALKDAICQAVDVVAALKAIRGETK